jgi:archaellum component FlaC
LTSQETIEQLEAAVARLVDRYHEVQQQLGVLEEANRHQRDELIRTHAELQELQGKYKSLQTAHALTADTPERSQARKQLNAIISKVDKTLELLKE